MEKEAPREPKVSNLSNRAIQLITDLIFHEDNYPDKIDVLFVFGTRRGVNE